MNLIKRLFNVIDRGMKGLNKGLSMGLPKLESIIDGIQRQTYTIITGGTGSGKTTLALYSYVYRPILDNMHNDKYRVVYFSLEMTAEVLLAKILSLHIHEEYGVELSYKDIMSRQEILSETNYQLLLSCAPWLEEFTKHLVIYDKPMTARGMFKILSDYAENHGYYEENETSRVYHPKIKDETVMVVVDHLGLLHVPPGSNKKQEMDLASKFLIRFRNVCSYSPLVLLQLNRSSNTMDRRKADMQEIELSDIKDTGGPSEDAEVVLAIFFPWREKVSIYKDYKIRYLKDRFRAIQVLKSRLGEADKSVATNFFGSIGLWKELPFSEELKHLTEQEYEPYINLTAREITREEIKKVPVKEAPKMMFIL